MATSRVAQTLHFKQTDLIKTTGKDIDGVAIMGSALGEIIIEL